MSNAKHTPGPWSAAFSRQLGASVLRGPNAQHLGTIHSERDAALIAAAPDLLKELEQLLDQYLRFIPDHRYDGLRVKSAQTVIAKATGALA